MTAPAAAEPKCHPERCRSMQVCQLSSTNSTSYSEACGRLQSEPEVPKSVTVSVTGPIDPYRFNMFMSDLLAERGSDIKQMHGVLSIQGYRSNGTHFKFEGAQKTVRFGPAVGTAGDSAHAWWSQVTFSGHRLSAKDLQEALDSCAWQPVAPGWTEHFAPGIQQPFYFHQATGRKQWQRPAAVEAEPTSQPLSTVTLATNSQAAASQLSRPSSYASELSDNSLENASAVRMLRRPKRSATRSAVSCPCDASDACTAVFDIRCREEAHSSKRMRDEDVSSKLAELDVSVGCAALFDSASEIEAARIGQGKKLQGKVSSKAHIKQDVQRGKQKLRRSNSWSWTPKQFDCSSQLAALGC